MKSLNTFGVHFTVGQNREQNGKLPIFARINVNGNRCELALKQYLPKNDWNLSKGMAKPKTDELKECYTCMAYGCCRCDRRKEIIGKIDFMNPEIDPGGRINLLRVVIANPSNQLKPGMPAYVVLKNDQQMYLPSLWMP